MRLVRDNIEDFMTNKWLSRQINSTMEFVSKEILAVCNNINKHHMRNTPESLKYRVTNEFI